jgi:hypothetical protein
VLCTESGIGEITINNPGYGYPIGVVPTITVIDSSGIGTGFVGTVTMECLPGDNFCSINDINITNNGENYYDLNTLTVDVSPLPSCISDELIINGGFNDGSNGWTVSPTGLVPDAWNFSVPSASYDMTLYSSTQPGKLSQNILTPGKTYNISFKMSIKVTNGNGYVVVSAGTFNLSGTQPNQYLHTQLPGPAFNGTLTTTLTCTGTSEFSIYVYSDVPEITTLFTLDDISVIEICTAVDPDLEVTAIDRCGTFIVPGCSDPSNPTTYELWGGSQSVNTIYVCSPDPGPVAPKYTVQAEPGISCCACKLYNIIVRNPIDMYYTDCFQTIDIISVEAGIIGVTVCAIENSVWPANPADNAEILAITEVGDCTPTV